MCTAGADSKRGQARLFCHLGPCGQRDQRDQRGFCLACMGVRPVRTAWRAFSKFSPEASVFEKRNRFSSRRKAVRRKPGAGGTRRGAFRIVVLMLGEYALCAFRAAPPVAPRRPPSRAASRAAADPRAADPTSSHRDRPVCPASCVLLSVWFSVTWAVHGLRTFPRLSSACCVSVTHIAPPQCRPYLVPAMRALCHM